MSRGIIQRGIVHCRPESTSCSTCLASERVESVVLRAVRGANVEVGRVSLEKMLTRR